MENKRAEAHAIAPFTKGEGDTVARRDIATLIGSALGAPTISSFIKEAGSTSIERSSDLATALSGGNFLWVDTIAGSTPNLRSVTGSDAANSSKPVIVVGGYWNVGDGGGGVFYWNACKNPAIQDDGGTNIVPPVRVSTFDDSVRNTTASVEAGCYRTVHRSFS